MKIINYLENVIKDLNGSLLGIGLKDSKLINVIENNNNIKICNLLDSFLPDTKEKGKTKTVQVRNLRKKFKKNKTDFIICNIETVDKFKDKFVYDSVYIGKKKIYIYSDNIEIDSIIKKYKRYCSLTRIDCEDGIIYELKLQKKLRKYNQLFFEFIDFISEIINLIGNLLS